MAKTIRKMAALLMLAVFVLSIVPMVVADSDDTMEEGDAVRERHKGIMKEQVKEKVSKLRESRERFMVAKEKHLEVKEKYREHRAKFLELKGIVTACEDEECRVKAKSALAVGAKTQVERVVEVLDKSLDKLNRLIEGSEKLSEEDKAQGIESVESYKARLSEINEKVAGEITREELREVIKELKDLRKEVNELKRELVSHLTVFKVEKIAINLENIADSMKKRIQVQVDKGNDVTELETILEEFRNDIVHVKNAKELANEKFEEAKASGDREKYSEVREARSDAKVALQEAKSKLREFIAVFKELNTTQ
jgi:hypothetical protein